MATTPNYGLTYPTNYADPADAPAALEALALDADQAMTNIDNRVSTKATVYIQAAQPSSPKVGDIWVTP